MVWPVCVTDRADVRCGCGMLVGGGTAPMTARRSCDLGAAGRCAGSASARCRYRAVRPPGLRGPLSGARLQHQLPPTPGRRQAGPWRDGR
jgi:hypothetical protein